jgi:flagellar basal body-associated protein FliL
VLKKQLSPLVIVVVVAVALAIIAGVFFLFMHRHPAGSSESGAPPAANDPYASQYEEPPAKGGSEPGMAP